MRVQYKRKNGKGKWSLIVDGKKRTELSAKSVPLTVAELEDELRTVTAKDKDAA